MQNNYHVVNTCSTCKHRMEIMTIDWKYYTCNLDKTFHLNFVKKDVFEKTDDEILKEQEWQSSHEVQPNCVCNNFE